MIPVVLNGVNMTDIAPPHSYIDIRDFSSFEGIADNADVHITVKVRIRQIPGPSLRGRCTVCLVLLVEGILQGD